MIREGDAESIWSRLHARQALVFGLLASFVFGTILALPLLTVIFVPAISTGATIVVYSVGLIVDAVVAVLFVIVALRYSARAAHGELFAIPLVTRIVDTLFHVRQD